jgi:uncharacterized protein (DUF433 family)
VAAVVPYVKRGLSVEEILQAFPQLTRRDIEAARRHADVA